MNQFVTLVVKGGLYWDSKIIRESFCSHSQHAFRASRLSSHMCSDAGLAPCPSPHVFPSCPVLDPPPWNRLYEFYAAFGEAHQADLSSILSHHSASQRLRSFLSVVHTTASFLTNIILLPSVWNYFILVLLTLTSNHWCVLNGCEN